MLILTAHPKIGYNTSEDNKQSHLLIVVVVRQHHYPIALL